MDWSTKRKVTYGVTTLIVVLAVLVFIFQNVLFPDPTCFDGEKNGFESGIDCGGECVLRCSTDVVPTKIVFARALPVGNNRYDILGLIENKNIDNTPRELGYNFAVYDKIGALIFTYTGTTSISVSDEKPIIIQNQILNGIPDKTILTLNPAYHYKAKERPKETIIRTVRIRHEDGDIPRVFVTIKNQTQKILADIPVRIILYDAQRNAIGAGQSMVSLLQAEEQKEIPFTWNQPFETPIASTVVYYDFGSF